MSSPRRPADAKPGNALVNALIAIGSVAATYLFFELAVAPQLHQRLGWFPGAYLALDAHHRMPSNDADRPTNRDGIRSRRQPDEFEAEGFNIVFLGDSFTYGWGLHFEQSFPHLVERVLRAWHPERRVTVANFGWVSSSPLLSLALLDDIGAHYQPDLVVLCVDMTDFHDDLKYDRMLRSAATYRAMSRFPLTMTAVRRFAPEFYKRELDRATGIFVPHHRFFPVNQPLDRSRRYMQPLADNIAKIAERSRRLGAKFVLVVLPRAFQYSANDALGSWESHLVDVDGPYNLEPFRFFEELASQVDYPVHSLLDAFQQTPVFPTTFKNDPHWNVDGSRVATRAISELLEDYVVAAPE